MSHHATLPPSSFPAFMLCGCYAPGNAKTSAAAFGEDQHQELRRLLEGNHELADKLPLDQREGVEWAAGVIRQGADLKRLHVEEKLTLTDPETFEEITYGTADAWQHIEGDIPDLWDYKSGEIRDYRAQMAAYAVGIMQRTGEDRCRVTILYGRFRKKVTEDFTARIAWAIVNEVIRRRTDPTKEPTPCSYCAWCGDFLKCKAVLAQANAAAAARPDWSLASYYPSAVIDTAEMSKGLTLARRLREWADQFETYARQMAIDNGLAIPGYTLDERNGNREIGDIMEAYALSGLPRDVFLKCCKVTLGQLETAYAEFHQMALSAARRQLSEKIEPATTRKPNIIKLKPTK